MQSPSRRRAVIATRQIEIVPLFVRPFLARHPLSVRVAGRSYSRELSLPLLHRYPPAAVSFRCRVLLKQPMKDGVPGDTGSEKASQYNEPSIRSGLREATVDLRLQARERVR